MRCWWLPEDETSMYAQIPPTDAEKIRLEKTAALHYKRVTLLHKKKQFSTKRAYQFAKHKSDPTKLLKSTKNQNESMRRNQVRELTHTRVSTNRSSKIQDASAQKKKVRVTDYGGGSYWESGTYYYNIPLRINMSQRRERPIIHRPRSLVSS